MSDEKTQFNYVNFDLLIERSQGAYVARVLYSPAGQTRIQFSLPFSELELENFYLKIGRPRSGIRRLDTPEMETAKTFGKRLFTTIFDDQVLGCFRSSLDQSKSKGAGLRIRLRLNAPELSDLPWEYVYNPALNRFLALAVETPLVRYVELPERIPSLAVKPPLKILVMISSPADYLQLNADDEWAKLKNALANLEQRGLVALERLEEATLPALQQQLRQGNYHIFHFIGHGVFDERAQDGILLLEDEVERGRRVSGQYLGMLLHNHRPLRLTVLNACEGARTSRTDPFAGTAQTLVQQGIPAVVAMQFEITDTAAIAFAYGFYSAIAEGYPVDAALTEARIAIFAHGNDIEWGTPVLYMRSPDGRIFDIERVYHEEKTPDKIAVILREANAAAAKQNWKTALAKYQAVLKMEPTHTQAKAGSIQTQIEQELADHYAQGREHYQARRWQQAIECFRRMQSIKAHYKDIDTLVAATERELNKGKMAKRLMATLIVIIALTAIIYVFLRSNMHEPVKIPPQIPKVEHESLVKYYKNEGDAFFDLGEYARARLEYEQACLYKPDDEYIMKRIRECEQKIAEQEAEHERLYTIYKSEGDTLFIRRLYKDARHKYHDALNHEPGDRYIIKKIDECECQIARQARNITRSNLYQMNIDEGDALFRQGNLEAAKRKYEAALRFNQDDPYLKRQIRNCNEMVFIPGGTFQMGSNKGTSDEKPVHRIHIDCFYMDKCEVTVRKFKQFIDTTGHVTDAEKERWSYMLLGNTWVKKPGINWRFDAKGDRIEGEGMNHPVIHVSWNDAVAYANWAVKRLPTEAEWEYAARCETEGFKYSWGNGAPSVENGGNIADESAKREFNEWAIWDLYDDGYVYTAPVGSFTPNEFGLYDMTGNVREWCVDWYDKDYYQNSPIPNPAGPDIGSDRVLRGGSWINLPFNLRCAKRDWNYPSNRLNNVGFRCVR